MNDNETAEAKRQREIAAARAELARRYAEDPEAVKRFEARKANIDAVRRRERQRVDGSSQRDRPEDPDLTRPAGLSRQDWKVERGRRLREHRKALSDWNDRRRSAAILGPTPEQAAKAPYVEMTVNDYVGGRSIKIGRAFCRQPRFETIEGLTSQQLQALRRYRRAFDTSEISPIKSGLDIGDGVRGGGGAEAALTRIEAVAFADIVLTRLEDSVLPHLRPTLRAVALHDADFSEVAAGRFGSTSGARRTLIKSEFIAAADALYKVIETAARLAEKQGERTMSVGPSRAFPAEFIDDRGYMLSMDEIADIIVANWLGDTNDAA